MVQPIDIAVAAHKICEEELIPKGISPQHEVTRHSISTAYYAQNIESAGMGHVTGEQVIEAIIGVAGWDKASPWPGHPSADKVIERLKEEK